MKGNFIIENMQTRKQISSSNEMCLVFSEFETLEDAIEVLKLDRRKKWFVFNNQVVYNHPKECFPMYAIDNRTGNPVKIKSKKL